MVFGVGGGGAFLNNLDKNVEKLFDFSNTDNSIAHIYCSSKAFPLCHCCLIPSNLRVIHANK